jgi:FkbM family methyltransferase
MSNFGLVVIGACHGFDLVQDVNKLKKPVLLVEPLDYNFKLLKKNFQDYENIYFEQSFISNNSKSIIFYYVKEDSIKKLGKHWASGIGSFSKEHILNHKSKRFQIEESDIGSMDIISQTFNQLCEKYNIDTIDNLLIDVEGHEMSILKSIDFNKILISEIKFEFKHLTSTFNYENSLDELIKLFKQNNYSEVFRDKENITFKLNKKLSFLVRN